MLNHNNYLQAVSLTFKKTSIKKWRRQGLQNELHFSTVEEGFNLFYFLYYFYRNMHLPMHLIKL